ncbi:hypothetical protein AUP41_17935 [Thalassospira xiamenensis]|nr:hypothetical protein AUP41_17935 [Thalassospira xiamenensis]
MRTSGGLRLVRYFAGRKGRDRHGTGSGTKRYVIRYRGQCNLFANQEKRVSVTGPTGISMEYLS